MAKSGGRRAAAASWSRSPTRIGAVGVAHADQRRERGAQPLDLAGPRLVARATAATSSASISAPPCARERVGHVLRPRVGQRRRELRRAAPSPARSASSDAAGARPGRRRRAAAAGGTSSSSSAGLSTRRSSASEVLDVGGLEVAQAAVLDERDAAARQLELEQVASRGRCGTAPPARAAPSPPRARRAPGRTPRAACSPSSRQKHELRRGRRRRARSTAASGTPLRSCVGDRVGDVEDRLRRAVVALELDRLRAGNVLGEVEDVRGARGAEAVDRLEVVARPPSGRGRPAQAAHDVDLQAVDVLVLVDEHVVEARGRARPDHARRPPARASTAAGRRGRARRARACAPRRRGRSPRAPRVLRAPRERLGRAPRDSGRCALTVRE